MPTNDKTNIFTLIVKFFISLIIGKLHLINKS